ncbi:unknown protein [Microcystis aeruginosa NIES-843]|uniref:Uncharacterized protein n=1 Tax=Microcystis aeruginosa (strain NIES-843 / IAM M-2473) TaxID=449447 RepID=B0JG67_MICAN|nr:unknown protein [Microcystis aeruginosa NIES-843]
MKLWSKFDRRSCSTGPGDAHTNDTELPDIGVHYWLDAGTRLKYILKVWVED